MSDTAVSPFRVGAVTLTVRDLDGIRGFYRDIVGLRELSADPEVARLGAGGTVLLELRRDPHARPHAPREAGLFHTAFLLPSRADLGRWLGDVARRRVPIQGASDHAVSEAIYLADPEGNGVEVYADRPRAVWPWAEGMLAMRTDPLDIDDLLEAAGPAGWDGVPEGSVVGHVHLQTGAIEPAEAFYRDVLGLDVMARYPGASFYGAGGYHHHLATNIWNSRGAGVRTEPTTGLANVELLVTDAAALDAVGRRAAAAGIPASSLSSGFSLRDPWGTSLTLISPAEGA